MLQFVLAFQQSDLTPEEAAVLGMAALAVALVVLLIWFGIAIVIAALLYSAQKAVPPEHRKLEPGLAWLLLIPLFNLYWNFVVFLKVPESYQSLFHSRGRTDVGDAGRGIGLWYAISTLVATFGSFIPVVNCFAGVAALAAIVLLVVFLVKIYGLKSQIYSLPATTVPPQMPAPG